MLERSLEIIQPTLYMKTDTNRYIEKEARNVLSSLYYVPERYCASSMSFVINFLPRAFKMDNIAIYIHKEVDTQKKLEKFVVIQLIGSRSRIEPRL